MPKRNESWISKNIVALLALVVATIALVPLAIDLYEASTATKASVVGVRDSGHVSGQNLEVSVSYENKKDDMDLWLVLRAGVEGNWYPQMRVIPASDQLQSGSSEKVNVVLGTPGPFQLSVYATSPSQGIAFREYFDQQGAPTGLVGLPDGMTRLTTVSFTRDQ